MKIQSRQGRAVKDNAGDAEVIKKRIFSILFDLSSKKSSRYDYCPLGTKP